MNGEERGGEREGVIMRSCFLIFEPNERVACYLLAVKTTETVSDAHLKKKKKGEEQKTEKEENDEHEGNRKNIPCRVFIWPTHTGMDEASLQAHLMATKVKTIERI